MSESSPARPSTSSPKVRKRPSTLLEVSTIASNPSVLSLDELAEWEDSLASLQRKPSADEFSRIVNEISSHRRLNGGPRHRKSHQSFASSDDGRSTSSRYAAMEGDTSALPLRLCCCGQTECDVAQRVSQQLQDMESDLQLSAEIGQALLQRQDAIVHRAQQESEEHAQQRDQLLGRLSQSIKETQRLEHQLSQAQFNLEAADQSQHALLAELEGARQQLKQMKMHRVKVTQLEARLTHVRTELEDTKAELAAERRRRVSAEKKHKQLMVQRCSELSERLEEEAQRTRFTQSTAQAYARAWEAVQARLASAHVPDQSDGSLPDDALRSMVEEHEALCRDHEHLQSLLQAANDEVAQLQEAAESSMPLPPALDMELANSVRAPSSSSSVLDPPSGSDKLLDYVHETTPSLHSHEDTHSHDTGSLHAFGSEHGVPDPPHETRSALLGSLMDTVSRTYTKLQQADIDTLATRLQRQKLAGDVAHLSRTTIQANIRDIEGMKEHFRVLLEKEARRGTSTQGSLVTRRDFFALVKLHRESLLELARLRRCVNDIQLNPSQASKLLHEHLGASTTVSSQRSWISRMLTGVLSSDTSSSPDTTPPSTPSINESAFVRFPTSEPVAATTPSASLPMPMSRALPEHRTAAPPSRMLPRASAAVMSTSVAVHVHGMHSSGKPGMLKTKASQPNLLQQAAGGSRRVVSQTPSMPPVPAWHEPMLRPRARGLSDSSIHSTFLEHGATSDAAVDRVLTPAALTLSTD
ncbi:hypothetical protein Malapachy_2614 [Malassezia pachydermatis]|uniref:Uncharacterized protein n=1 Tax=Malassezia pachydermatis TaxID=77020 RepID=A0A0M8MW10_9BASI|nr:hypothetical protein Malapachy_2614 [Malassezia pachydermatis]KOS15464.1 hypothetical protein Malapachy_2614 [Malassezia pachydermatis]